MNNPRQSFYLRLSACFALAACVPALAHAQSATNSTRQQRLSQYVTAANKIPAAKQKLLSGSTLNLLHFAQEQTQKHSGFSDGSEGDGGRPALPNASVMSAMSRSNKIGRGHDRRGTLPDLGPGVVPVSNPELDYELSVLGGFTQNETSTAWCGNTVVSAYNDSGAYLRTAGLNPNAGASFNGVAVSFNGGRSFHALEYLNPGTDPANFLGGDGVLSCTGESTVYESSLFTTATAPDAQGKRKPLSAVSLSTSLNGGLTWQPPVTAAAKDGLSHFLDKEWMTADIRHPLDIYVTYTDFDFSLSSLACPGDVRYAVELVSSSDGGQTWSAPSVIEQQCDASGNAVQGSQVAVDSKGAVKVAYETFNADGSRSIKIASSTNHGTTFSAPRTVSTIVPTGDGSSLQGLFRTNDFPSLAIDPANDELYLAWTDGVANQSVDLLSPSGFYSYGDVVVSHSLDGGATWSQASMVSPTSQDFDGTGRDQFMPGIAVDHRSNVAVCYYDRRNDPLNVKVDRYCSISTNHGSSWGDERKTVTAFAPVHGNDGLINPAYMGDYDQTASDRLGQMHGFAGSFQILTNENPDVYLARF